MNNPKIKILIVEDTSADIFLIKFYLEELNPGVYSFIEAGNIEDAYKLLQTDRFDLILLDLHLPDSDGLITLTRTIEKFPDEVYIVLTGLSDEKMGIEAVKNGAEDFLVKGRLDGKILNNALRFAHERAKLKRHLKLFGEGIKMFENHFNLFVIFIDFKYDMVFYSTNFEQKFGANLKPETVEKLNQLTEEKDLIKDHLKNVPVNDCLNFEGTIKNERYKFCVKQSPKYNNALVLSFEQV